MTHMRAIFIRHGESTGNAGVPCHDLAAIELTERGHEQARQVAASRSEEHTSELQSLMRLSYAVFCLTKKKNTNEIQKIERRRRQQTTALLSAYCYHRTQPANNKQP